MQSEVGTNRRDLNGKTTIRIRIFQQFMSLHQICAQIVPLSWRLTLTRVSHSAWTRVLTSEAPPAKSQQTGETKSQYEYNRVVDKVISVYQLRHTSAEPLRDMRLIPPSAGESCSLKASASGAHMASQVSQTITFILIICFKPAQEQQMGPG